MNSQSVSLCQIGASADDLLAQARRQTGIDIDDAGIRERLPRLLDSLNHEAELSPSGAVAMSHRLSRLLDNRLRMLRDLDRHPEILEQEVRPPVFLTSFPRTGSTKLHKMLAASGDFLYLPGWHGHTLSLRTGDRSEDPGPRLRDSEAYETWFHERAPKAAEIHDYLTNEPDEDTLILEHGLFALYMSAFAFVPSYGQWFVTTQNFRDDFRFVKQGLQYLQWQFHDGDARRWLLKCPGYFGWEALLTEEFPGAAFVTTNRHPAATMCSTASLLSNYHRLYSEADHDRFLGSMMLEGFAASAQLHLTARDVTTFDDRFLDVGYHRLTQNAGEVARDVYRHIGVTLSEEARDAMRGWESDDAAARRNLTAHNYLPETFGLTSTQVEERFSSYLDRFGHLL